MLAIILSCISSIGNAVIVLETTSFSPEIKELNVFFACIFTVFNLYDIYKSRQEDEHNIIDTSNEPVNAPGDNLGSYITVDTTSSMFYVPTDEE
jgi:hypothetical protein